MKDKIQLAALLHDIGKFYQRADTYEKENYSWKLLTKEYSNLQTEYCPQYQDKYTHKHVLWTAQFIHEILKISEKSSDQNSLMQLAARHHKPHTFEEQIITLADHLSSGMDRNKHTKDAEAETDFGNYKTTPLLSIFETIGHELQTNKQWKYRMPVSILDTKDIMPVTKEEMPAIEKTYQSTWFDFEKEINQWVANGFEVSRNNADTLYFLLNKYLVNIPSSTQDLPDVSLFDHSKTVAAFSVCLWEYAQEKNITNILELRKATPFILYGADLSGIQKYIYNIVSKNAAKNLKGRSFYLHVITTTIIQKILDELGLYQSNVVYNSGGGFYLLLPNTDRVKNKLNTIQKEIEKELFEKFSGELYLATGFSEMSCDILFEKNIHVSWANTIQEIQNSKRKKFSSLIHDDFNMFFEPQGKGNETERDCITGEELSEGYKKIDICNVNRTTYEQIELGKSLKKTKYWHIIKDSWSDKEVQVSFLGYTHLFKEQEDIRLADLNHICIALNNMDFLPQDRVKSAQYRFDFYGGNDYPVDEEGEPKSFDELTMGQYNKLGIVRMDVDNLGIIFSSGFTKENKTLSRYSTLSRNLDLFFKGYLNTIWTSNENFKNHTVILYSGGDDLFVLGDWKIVMDFASEIRNKFRAFTCQNPLFTLSGGLLLTPPKFPILKASSLAEKTEKIAKSYEDKLEIVTRRVIINNEEKIKTYPKTKDAFAFLDTAMSWDNEYLIAQKLMIQLCEKINNKEYPKALLHTIMHHFNEAKIVNNTITNSRTIWLMNYDFKRRADETKKEEHKEELLLMLKDMIENKFDKKHHTFAMHSFKLYYVAARWAELTIRNQ
jgi:CRISPR-associated protein Csm1